MSDFSKTPGSRRNPVRQIKGPGMNKGLAKRHKLAKPKKLPGIKPFGAVGGKGQSGVRTDNTASNPLSPTMQLIQNRDPHGLRRKTWSSRRDFGKGSSKGVL